MSIISTTSNYGGKITDFQQNVKQFVISGPSQAIWIYKRLTNGLLVQTPANQKYPVLINSDLIITGSLYNTSDERLKQDIQPIDSALDKVLQLRGVTYKPNSIAESLGYTKQNEVGVIAQDVQKVLPEAVKPAPFDIMLFEGTEISRSGENYMTVQYEKIIPLLIEAIKDLNNQIKELKESK